MIANELVVINVFITVGCIWLLMVLNSRILRPTLLNKKRFKLYQIRDRLAILAMRNVINEDSEEYATLIRLINNTLRSTKEFRITSFIRAHSALATDKKLRQHISNIIKKIENENLPQEYTELVQDYFEVARDIFNHKTLLLKNIFFPIFLLVFTILGIVKFFDKVKNSIKAVQTTVSQIGEELSQDVYRVQSVGSTTS
jgi:hypothetical protein